MRTHHSLVHGRRPGRLRRVRRHLPVLLLFGFAACGDAERNQQPTSIDPGDRFGEVAPARVVDLGARTLDHRAVELTWTEVEDGKGAPAQYQVRVAEGNEGWEQATRVDAGACAYPVQGSTIGNAKSCIVAGLEASRMYRFLIGAERRDVTGTVRGDPSAAATVSTAAEPFADVPATFTVTAGAAQEGTVGQALQEEILVELKDAAGEPMKGLYVVWSDGEGGGSAAAPLSVTNQFGIARTVWTLGPRAGTQTLGVRVAGHDEVTLSADAAPGPVERLELAADTVELSVGDEHRLVVQGWDAYGNLVEEFPVEWETSDGDVANVDATGVVRSTERGWVRIRTYTRDRLRKRKQRDSTTVVVKTNPTIVTDLALTGVGESWAAIEFTEVDDGAGRPARYEVRVGDTSSDWDGAAAPTVGTCGETLDGTAIGARRSCTIDGLVPGSTTRVFVRSFRKERGSQIFALSPAQLDATTLDPPPVPSGVRPESGVNQAGTVGSALPEPVVVRVIDDTGNPVEGAQVTFAPSDGGSVSANSVATDANGRAAVSWTLGARAGMQSLSTEVQVPTGSSSGPSAAAMMRAPSVTIAATAVAGAPHTVTVTPSSLSLAEGATATLSVEALDEWGNRASTSDATWTSDDPSVASVAAGGEIVANGGGTTTVRAQVGGAEGTVTVMVEATPAPETPDPTRIEDLRVVSVGENEITLEFTQVDDGTGNAAWAQMRYAFSPIGWGWGQATGVSSGACSSPMVGTTVGEVRRCVVTGLQSGTAYDFQMVAWRVDDGVNIFSPLSNIATGTTESDAPPPPEVSSVVVSPGHVDLEEIGSTAQLYANAYDGSNGSVNTPIEWVSSDASVATVGADGVVTSVGAGTATITATALCCAVSDAATVTVTVTQTPPPPPPPPTITSLEVAPGNVTFDQLGQSLQLTATAYDSNGNAASTDISWSSSDPSVATVSSGGRVTARAVGTALITAVASCCTVSDDAQITVSITQPPPPAEGLLAEQTWNFPDRATMYADPNLAPKRYHEHNGWTAPIVLDSPGPWGGNRAVEIHFNQAPPEDQPQVGVEWHIPDGLHEFWFETWVRFGPEWDIGPTNPYAGGRDHKTLFFFEDGQAQRWELKFGANGYECSAAIGGQYVIGFMPPVVGPWDYDEYVRRSDDRCDPYTHVWDAQWHRVRAYLRMGTGDGTFKAWLDDQMYIDMGEAIDTESAGRAFQSISFGANRNSGPAHGMSFFFGPARVYGSDPGWM